MNKDIDIRVIVDTREQKIDYIKYIKLDQRRNKDRTKIIEVVQRCCTPSGCSKSTGDITYEYSLDGGVTWTIAAFSIELKKGNDILSSIYTKANFERLKKEIDRASKSNISFWFLVTDSLYQTRKSIVKLRKLSKNADIIYFSKLKELNKYLNKSGFDGIITTGRSAETLGWTIRRLIKDNIKKIK